jgi:hypothetical protein
MTIESNEDKENGEDSICLNWEGNSHENDLSDLRDEKQSEPRISNSRE